MQILKQVVGIDVSKDSLAVCFASLHWDLKQKFTASKSFKNTLSGHKELLNWVNKNVLSTEVPLWFVMEATGVYYENLAYYLAQHGCSITVLLPNKAKNYMKTLDNKSKTDGLDAQALAQFGLEKPLRKWQIPDKLFRELRSLSREYEHIKSLSTETKNRMHAKEHSFEPCANVIKRLKQQLLLYNKQLKEIESQMQKLVKQNKELNDKIEKIQKVKGIGFKTIVSIISETDGFALIENGKQLTSYSGLDVVHNQSGYTIRKTKISKKGNSHIRAALYMPAVSASRFNPTFKKIYLRLLIRKNIKKIAHVAVMRKLLLLIYTLWKNNVEYMPNYDIA
jgi:transposase